MNHVFVTTAPRALPRWLAAFPDLQLCGRVDRCSDVDSETLYWLDLRRRASSAEVQDSGSASRASVQQQTQKRAAVSDSQQAVGEITLLGAAVIALSATPSETEAFACLARGARGYCHVQASTEVFREVAAVVSDGRLWMPPDLVARITGVAQRLDAPVKSQNVNLAPLTEREEQVALLVGRGFNNREIAQTLSVSERTVKAKLTCTFEKLGLRDRVQLALYVNRLPIH